MRQFEIEFDYRVGISAKYIKHSINVEADTEEEAEDKARDYAITKLHATHVRMASTNDLSELKNFNPFDPRKSR
ncbi:hypothetical protein DVH26_07830 [Paenibacillus sp. H1-7]|uniref:hypothetical protein n=1 Tax=Paenibacillus sp. H1-7 TaxID=2282849 RepID=UPI001EF81B20|nr:hypothetical protein [Paenibacillus sp. H1-7]ULL14367.1 hypothetical protein DVH26_07830 [Paenibacillus sp. H1-7]